MSKPILWSAKFKRDYVAFSAVVIFCLIVLAEIALAVSIPAYLERENAMALQVRRLRMLESFDGARYFLEHTKNNEEKAVMELRLISWNFNLLSVYLRENSGKMTGDEISEVTASIRELDTLARKIDSQGAVCEEYKLDPTFYLNALVPEQPQQ